MSAQPTEGLTLGDILGAALSGAALEAERLREDRLYARSQYLSALELADQAAPLFGVTPAEVFDSLCTVPDNMLSLLASPEGWMALAAHVAADLRLPLISYQPTIH